ncbi:MAG: YgiT-type zinc finger protein [Anaerolineales bacterium]
MSEPETEFALPSPFPCTECSAGIMHPRLITYYTWLGEELVTVPHFPAWVCDICGKRDYDGKAIAWMKILLSPNAGSPTSGKRRIPSIRKRPHNSARPLTNS